MSRFATVTSTAHPCPNPPPSPSGAPRPAIGPHARRQAGAGARRTARKIAAYEFGLEAENRVARMLHSEGYVLLASRARNRAGEVDLIASRDDVVAFIEVKARRHGYDGLESVDQRKRRRLTRASEHWLAENPEYAGHSIRFDVALVWSRGLPEYLENAFEAVPDDDFKF